MSELLYQGVPPTKGASLSLYVMVKPSGPHEIEVLEVQPGVGTKLLRYKQKQSKKKINHYSVIAMANNVFTNMWLKVYFL